MTFVVDLLVDGLGRILVWLAAESLLASVGLACALGLLRGFGRSLALRSAAWAALGGAVLGASLVDRFDLPMALELIVWRRSVPIVWSVAGAFVMVGVWAWVAGSTTNPGEE